MGKSRNKKRKSLSTAKNGGETACSVLLKKPKVDAPEFFVDVEGSEKIRSRIERKRVAKAKLATDAEEPSSSKRSSSAKHPLPIANNTRQQKRAASRKRAAAIKKRTKAAQRSKKVKVESSGTRREQQEHDTKPVLLATAEPIAELDIWNEGAEKAYENSLPKATLRSFTVTLEPERKRMKQAKRVAKQLRSTAKFKAVVPLPGSSINPTPEDHKAAVKAAADYLVARTRIEDAAKKKFRDVAKNPPKTADSDDEDEDSEDDNTVPVSRPATDAGSRITRVQKNKRLRQRAETQQGLAKKALKAHRRELEQIPEVVASVAAETEAHAKKLEQRQREAAEAAAHPTTGHFGKHRYQPAFPDVQLVEDMADDLRSLKPTGDAFLEIQTSLERKNLVEPRKKVKLRRKHKKKFYTLKQDTMWSGNFHENQKKRRWLDKKLSK